MVHGQLEEMPTQQNKVNSLTR